MREFLTSGLVGNIELDAQKKIRESIQKRWDELGFTDGLYGTLKENIAILYENEAAHMLKEATSSDNSGSFETVVFPIVRRVFSKLLANDIVSVQAMNLPVGKLFFILPQTSQREWEVPADAQYERGDIVDGATGRHLGLMGYDRTNRNKEGRIEPRYYLPDEVINELQDAWYIPVLSETTTYNTFEDAKAAAEAEGLNATSIRRVGPEVTKYFEKSLYDLFYDDFLYDNSKGKVTIKVGEAVPMVLTPMGMREFGGANLTDYFKSGFDGTIRNVILAIDGFSAFNAGRLTGPDGNEMDTEAFISSLKVITQKEFSAATVGDSETAPTTSAFRKYESVPFRVMTQKYGKGLVEYNGLCDADGKIYIELDLAKPVVQQAGTIDGYIGVDPAQLNAAIVSGDTEATKENIKQLFKIAWAQYDSLELETEIGEVSMKLDSVNVAVEERKLRATWSPELSQDIQAFHNIDAEAELTAILSEQIAAEIDREVLRDLRKEAPWAMRWDANGWRRMAAFSTNYTQKDWNQELITKINQISAQINKATLRGGANFAVISAEISALFDNLEYFHVSDASAESDEYNMGIEKLGSLSNRYQIIMDPLSPHWSIIVGHKGKSLLDTGYIYAPYVPLQLTPTMYNPMNAAPIKYIMTRYAKKCVCNKYYGTVRVDGLVHYSVNEFR